MKTAHTKNDQLTPDYSALKARQQATWGAGDYGCVGVTLQITGEQLCEAMDLRSGQSVLDQADDGGMVVPSEYLEVVIDR